MSGTVRTYRAGYPGGPGSSRTAAETPAHLFGRRAAVPPEAQHMPDHGRHGTSAARRADPRRWSSCARLGLATARAPVQAASHGAMRRLRTISAAIGIGKLPDFLQLGNVNQPKGEPPPETDGVTWHTAAARRTGDLLLSAHHTQASGARRAILLTLRERRPAEKKLRLERLDPHTAGSDLTIWSRMRPLETVGSALHPDAEARR
jgi:hypothetical protein